MLKRLSSGSLAAAMMLTLACPAGAAEPIPIGLAMSLSGWFAPIDASSIRGATLAVEEINAKGGVLGRPLSVMQFDNKSDPQLTADGATDLLSKGAKMLLLPSDFDFGAAGAYVAQQQGVIAFSGASDPKFGVQGIGPLAYSDSTAAQAQGSMLAEWGFKQKGWRTAYVLLDNTISFTKSLCGSFADRWKAIAGADALVGQDTFLNGDASIAAQRTRIASLPKKPDVIMLCSYAPGGPSAIRQLRTAGIDAPIVTGESMDGDYWIGNVPDLSNFFVIDYGSVYGDDSDPAVNAFFARFKAKYGERADTSYPLRAYSAVQAFAIAAEKAKSVDGDKVAAVLDTFKDQPLVAGPTTYTPELHIQTTRPMAIVSASGGKFSFVTRVTTTNVDLKGY
jgi:branched-chain amino acid transport system substrate-binding protein